MSMTKAAYWMVFAFALMIWAPAASGRSAGEQTDLVVVTPLSITPSSPGVGQTVTASFAVRNTSAASITLNRIGVGGRGPGCTDFACEASYRDFELLANVTIAPGETFTYERQRSFPTSGAHFVQITYEQPVASWYFLGSRIDFTVQPGLAITEPLRLTPAGPTTKDLVAAEFTLRNDGSTPLAYARVGVGSRGPDCVPGDWGCVKSVDFGFEDNVTLAPGESRRFVFWRLYGATGDYFAQISIQDTSNVWSNIGERADFIVSAASYAPRQLPLAFGVQWHPAWAEARDEAELALAYSTGAKVLRIGVSWRLLEPSGKGQWDTGWYIPALSHVIEVAHGYGMDVQILLLQVPCWASSDPNKNCALLSQNPDVDPWDDAYPPVNYQDYVDAFAKLVELYGDRVDTWEVWNEPNVERFWKPAPDASAYVNLLRLTRGVIRQMQPEAIVLGGSLAGGDVKFLSEMYAAGAKGNFDGLALHPYSLPRAPDDYSDCRWSFSCAIDSIRSMMEAQGDAKPVYLTEFGWSTCDGVKGVSESVQQQYLAEALAALNLREFVASAAWYTLVDTNIQNLPEDLVCDNDFGLFTIDHRAKVAGLWLQEQHQSPHHLYLSLVAN